MDRVRLIVTTLLFAATFPLSAGQLTEVGNLTAARRDVSATALGDGGILVAGGPTETVEVLRSSRRGGAVTARVQGATRLPLVGHTATALSDGRVLLIGGGYQTDGRPGFGFYGNVDVDIADGAGVTPLTSLHQYRSGHAATLLADGRVLVTGGHSLSLGGFHVWETVFNSSEIVDPAGGTSSPGPAMIQARTDHTATMLHDGRILIAGGRAERFNAIAAAEVFDPLAGTYAPLPEMRAPRYGHTATVLPDGRVLIAGGAEEPFEVAEFFDPATNEFHPATGVDIGYRRHHTATLLADGTVLFAGGAEDAVLYDPTADAIVDQVMFGGHLSKHAAFALPSGGVLLIGGVRADSYTPSTGILRYTRNSASRRRAVR